MISIAARPRSLEEAEFYIDETPCERCGALGETDLRWDTETPVHVAIVRGPCRRCGLDRAFRFPVVEDIRSVPDDMLARGDAPSTLLSPELLVTAANRALADVPEVPPPQPKAARRGSVQLRRARRAVRELEKFAPEQRPAEHAALRATIDRLSPIYEAAVPRPPPRPRPLTLAERARAHRGWLQRGRAGEGRLVMRGEKHVGQNMGNPKLTAAELVDTVLDRCQLSMADFDEATLTRCSFVQAGLASVDFTRATIEACTLRQASLRLAKLVEAQVTGGDWSMIDAGRGFWHHARFDDVSLRDAWLRDTVLDDARLERCDLRGADLRREKEILRSLGTALRTRFVDCDLRGARIDGWRLRGTVFERCKLHGVTGVPRLEGPVTVIDADLSEAGDGSLRGGNEVVDEWWTVGGVT